ncbi:MAG: hypothetical protein L3J47_12405 [Sulfurovum sp.]|nr:hypothetical protein [Sulfurovum sp.]
MIVVVRPATLRGRAINVYIDGEYLTSLLPGAYTTERICPGKHRLRLAYTNVLTRYKEKNSGGQFFLFKPNSTYYVGIVKEGNQLRLRILSDKEAKRVNKDYDKRQTHTISRVSKKKCLKALKRIRKEKKD